MYWKRLYTTCNAAQGRLGVGGAVLHAAPERTKEPVTETLSNSPQPPAAHKCSIIRVLLHNLQPVEAFRGSLWVILSQQPQILPCSPARGHDQSRNSCAVNSSSCIAPDGRMHYHCLPAAARSKGQGNCCGAGWRPTRCQHSGAQSSHAGKGRMTPTQTAQGALTARRSCTACFCANQTISTCLGADWERPHRPC